MRTSTGPGGRPCDPSPRRLVLCLALSGGGLVVLSTAVAASLATGATGPVTVGVATLGAVLCLAGAGGSYWIGAGLAERVARLEAREARPTQQILPQAATGAVAWPEARPEPAAPPGAQPRVETGPGPRVETGARPRVETGPRPQVETGSIVVLAAPASGPRPSPAQDLWEWIRPQVIECWVELLGVYGVEVRFDAEVDQRVVNGGVAAVIGFTGAAMSGSVMISMPMSLAQAAHPIDPRHCVDPLQDMLDWVGELSNQYLGRLKNRLMPYGVLLGVGVPTTMLGSQMRDAATPAEGRRLLRFAGFGTTMHLRVEVVQEADVPMGPPTPIEGALSEGDMLML